jgi:Domain of unknown function (DUF4398)
MLRYMLVLLGVACLLGCVASPPVQEMSDARQAIAAAQTAGATAATSLEIQSAQLAIERAEGHIQAHEYTRARLAAQAAKRHAAAALAVIRHDDPPPPSPY